MRDRRRVSDAYVRGLLREEPCKPAPKILSTGGVSYPATQPAVKLQPRRYNLREDKSSEPMHLGGNRCVSIREQGPSNRGAKVIP